MLHTSLLNVCPHTLTLTTVCVPPPRRSAYRKFVESLPLVDNPEVFGMHSNADLVFRTAQTGQVLSTILDISPKDSGGGSGGESS